MDAASGRRREKDDWSCHEPASPQDLGKSPAGRKSRTDSPLPRRRANVRRNIDHAPPQSEFSRRRAQRHDFAGRRDDATRGFDPRATSGLIRGRLTHCRLYICSARASRCLFSYFRRDVHDGAPVSLRAARSPSSHRRHHRLAGPARSADSKTSHAATLRASFELDYPAYELLLCIPHAPRFRSSH